jgi:general secretion pathway protein H
LTAQNSQQLTSDAVRLPHRLDKMVLSHRGFTLIEMAMVLFIVILGFTAIGSSIGTGNRTATHQSAARDMASALRFARGHALMMREQTTVDISLADNSYTVSGRDKVYSIPEDIAVTVVTAQEDLTGKDEAKIRFFPDGSSTGGRIKLEQNGVNWQIDINWLTGQINLEEQ